MLWKRVKTEDRIQPKSGSWPAWKDAIANDCYRQCVYCAIPDSRYGGLDNFHIDHYRPKKRFPKLSKKIHNLYLACAICNRFKSDDWPDEPVDDHGCAAYPDPGRYEYGSLIDVDKHNGVITGKYVAAKYVVERLYLNRPQLIRLRRAAALESRLQEIEDFLQVAIDQLKKIEHAEAARLLAEIVQALIQVSQAYRQRENASPYQLSEIRRPKTLQGTKAVKRAGPEGHGER